MNLHQIQIHTGWAGAHVYRNPNACSEGCDEIGEEGPNDHLVRRHGLRAPTWVCECTDRTVHAYDMCETVMGSEDANIDAVNDDPYNGRLLNRDFPFIYVCPDCRDHNHGRRARTR